MMLALDTANFQTSIAIYDGQQIIANRQNNAIFGGEATLMMFLMEIFEQENIKPVQLTAVAVTRGPGSFTGTRIGLAAARAFTLSLKIPLFTLTSFEWVARSFIHTRGPLSGPLQVILESQRTEKFTQTYGPTLDILKTATYQAPSSDLATLSFITRIGNAAPAFDSTLNAPYMPTAIDLVNCVLEKQAAGGLFDDCTPFYLRPPEIHSGH